MWLSFSVATTAGAADADSTGETGVATGAGAGDASIVAGVVTTC